MKKQKSKRVGRPASANPKGKYIKIRVTDSEHEQVSKDAKKAGYNSITDYVRSFLFGE